MIFFKKKSHVSYDCCFNSVDSLESHEAVKFKPGSSESSPESSGQSLCFPQNLASCRRFEMPVGGFGVSGWLAVSVMRKKAPFGPEIGEIQKRKRCDPNK